MEGIKEVFHASFTTHVYPAHTHDAWTLMVLDTGAVRYELDRHEHGALVDGVTLLPPHVPHDGRSAHPTGFHKRVLYLDDSVLPSDLIGKAVDTPMLPDPLLRHRVHQLHLALDEPFEAAVNGADHRTPHAPLHAAPHPPCTRIRRSPTGCGNCWTPHCRTG